MSINTAYPSAPALHILDPGNDTGVSESIVSDQYSKELKSKKLNNLVVPDDVTKKQVLPNTEKRPPTGVELENAVNAYTPSESNWRDFVAAKIMLDDEVRKELIFDPGAWEKHANVLIAAILALSISRVTNAELRGHFGVMAAEAAKSQGKAIMESGEAAIYSAVTAAVVSTAISGFAMIKTFQGQGLKHTDIKTNQRNALDAKNIERDLTRDRARDDWNPDTTYKITVFDDYARPKTVDFKPSGTTLTPKEQALFDADILKAQAVSAEYTWLSQASGKGIEKKIEIGRGLNAIAMSLSQGVSSIVRMNEHAAREKETLQQHAQSTQRSLSDEVGQKDSDDAVKAQKMQDVYYELLQSGPRRIAAITA